jgi:tetratricopeptide (TPR) repeat protein
VADGWDVAHVDELDAIDVAGVHWRPVRRRFDIRAFGTNVYTADTGEHVVEEHTEAGGGAGGHEELYVVLRGRATFTVEGEERDAPAGTLVVLRDPKLKRSAVATEDGTAVLAVGGEPGQAFAVSPWEHVFAAAPFFASQDWDRAISTISAGLEDNPEHPSLLFNLACAEARSGRTAEAQAHLDRAVELNPKLAEQARADEDLQSLFQ